MPELSQLIWSVADKLRGKYKPSEYGEVILPLTVLRRLDCVLAPTKDAVLKEKAKLEERGLPPEHFVKKITGMHFANTSKWDMDKLLGDPDNIRHNLEAYINDFTPEVLDIFEKFKFTQHINRLDKSKLLYMVVQQFAGFDLSPQAISNHEMGSAFEELILKFADASNETAGEHFTPRDAIKLMVRLLISDFSHLSKEEALVRSIYDPTAGTGGMLSVASEYLKEIHPNVTVSLFGQELNDESYAVCKADMLIKGQKVSNIVAGNTLSEDGHPGMQFDYMLSNPPFGVEWKNIEKEIKQEYEQLGNTGRFGSGLPRISDGSMLFLLHLLSKMKPQQEGGSRIAIVLNGSPMFTGGAGSGESEIRRYVLENDLLEAIVALPTEMFFNTSIATYVWILSNNKSEERKGKVQLIDASSFYNKMKKSAGSKRRQMNDDYISLALELFHRNENMVQSIVKDKQGQIKLSEIHSTHENPPHVEDEGSIKTVPLSLILKNEDFGYRTVTVERPLRQEDGTIVIGSKGKQKGLMQANSSLRDTENVPLTENINTYMEREVLSYVPDAWIDEQRTKVGYEIPFNKAFYVFEPPRPLEAIDADIKQTTKQIMVLLGSMTV
jgi:type I restriction enzyme M protein